MRGTPWRRAGAALLIGALSLAVLRASLAREAPSLHRSCDGERRAARERDSVGRARGCRDAAPGPTEPITVIAAGPIRSGTTWLYNALRLMMLEKDPNAITGWYEDLSAAAAAYPSQHAGAAAACATGGEPTLFDKLRSTGASVLVKLHKYPDWDRLTGEGPNGTIGPPRVDMVYSTVRDLFEIVRSARVAGNWTIAVPDEVMANPTFCRKYVSAREARYRLYTAEDWADAAQWVRAARRIALCADRFRDRVHPSAFGGVVSHRHLRERPWAELLGELARPLQRFRGWGFSDSALARIAGRLRLLRPPGCEGWLEVNPATHFHRGHAHSQAAFDAVGGAAAERRGAAALRADQDLRSLAERNGLM